ncbi:MAG: type I methionyl aminopeptidase [Bacillota bacterium]|nr:type I methionyl aminopeptidase [Bacillota bacterium]
MINRKTNSEIELMKKSSDILVNALIRLKEAVKPGITTLELDKIAEQYIRKNGAIPSFLGYKSPYRGAIDYPGSICASVNNEVVHGIPGLRALKDGDIISIDIGVYINGFHSDAARTFPVGNISQQAQDLIDATKQSFYEGIKNAVVGKRICDISTSIQEYIEGKGYSIVRDYVGHGIGRDMHEDPQIPNYKFRGANPRLEQGMALAIEPMVNAGSYNVKLLENKWTVVTLDNSLSAHYENTIIVTDDEPVILTGTPE